MVVYFIEKNEVSVQNKSDFIEVIFSTQWPMFLMKKKDVGKIRLFWPKIEVLYCWRKTFSKVLLGVRYSSLDLVPPNFFPSIALCIYTIYFYDILPNQLTFS